MKSILKWKIIIKNFIKISIINSIQIIIFLLLLFFYILYISFLSNIIFFIKKKKNLTVLVLSTNVEAKIYFKKGVSFFFFLNNYKIYILLNKKKTNPLKLVPKLQVLNLGLGIPKLIDSKDKNLFNQNIYLNKSYNHFTLPPSKRSLFNYTNNEQQRTTNNEHNRTRTTNTFFISQLYIDV